MLIVEPFQLTGLDTSGWCLPSGRSSTRRFDLSSVSLATPHPMCQLRCQRRYNNPVLWREVCCCDLTSASDPPSLTPVVDYATGQFADALARLLLSSAQELIGSRLSEPIVLPRDVVDGAVKSVQKSIDTQTEKLRQLAADAALRSSLLGPPPKRPASDDDLRFGNSTPSKRFRPSPSEDGLGGSEAANGLSASPPPSTSGATDSSEKPIVTVAMLRALTREMLSTYGK